MAFFKTLSRANTSESCGTRTVHGNCRTRAVVPRQLQWLRCGYCAGVSVVRRKSIFTNELYTSTTTTTTKDANLIVTYSSYGGISNEITKIATLSKEQNESKTTKPINIHWLETKTTTKIWNKNRIACSMMFSFFFFCFFFLQIFER